jgi:hypothetical protein
MTGVLEAPLTQILLKRQPEHVLEEMRQIRQREMLPPRDLPKQQLALIVGLNVFDDGEQAIGALALRQIILTPQNGDGQMRVQQGVELADAAEAAELIAHAARKERPSKIHQNLCHALILLRTLWERGAQGCPSPITQIRRLGKDTRNKLRRDLRDEEQPVSAAAREEAMRLHGIDKIKVAAPKTLLPPAHLNERRPLEHDPDLHIVMEVHRPLLHAHEEYI